jgi:hypothetical protein
MARCNSVSGLRAGRFLTPQISRHAAAELFGTLRRMVRMSLTMMARIAGAALLTMAAVPASAQSNTNTTVDSIMSLFGLKQDESPEIDYRERAPLVVPPSNQLRPPEERGARRTASWPNDPDVQRRQREAAERKILPTERDTYRMGGTNNTKLSIDEIRAGRVAGANVNTTPKPSYGDGNRDAHWLNPDQLRALDRPKEAEQQIAAGQEPPRRYLTDPPPGLRKPSANAPLVAPRGPINTPKSDRDVASPYEWQKPQTE